MNTVINFAAGIVLLTRPESLHRLIPASIHLGKQTNAYRYFNVRDIMPIARVFVVGALISLNSPYFFYPGVYELRFGPILSSHVDFLILVHQRALLVMNI